MNRGHVESVVLCFVFDWVKRRKGKRRRDEKEGKGREDRRWV